MSFSSFLYDDIKNEHLCGAFINVCVCVCVCVCLVFSRCIKKMLSSLYRACSLSYFFYLPTSSFASRAMDFWWWYSVLVFLFLFLLFLSLTLSSFVAVKNTLQSVLHRGDSFGVQCFDFR